MLIMMMITVMMTMIFHNDDNDDDDDGDVVGRQHPGDQLQVDLLQALQMPVLAKKKGQVQ